jgi:hypothetical protein
VSAGLALSAGAAAPFAAEAPQAPVKAQMASPPAAVRDSNAAPLTQSGGPAVAPVDSVLRPAGSGRRTAAPPDSAPARVPHGRFDAPGWVMLRSLAVPGWGQFQNRAWFKCVVLGGLDGYQRARNLDDERRVRRLQPQRDRTSLQMDNADEAVTKASSALEAARASGDPLAIELAQAAYDQALREQAAASAAYNAVVGPWNALVNRQVADLWLLGGVLAYSMLDAYVDAHFRDFKVEFEHDSAFPGGKPPSGQTRLFLRWTF